MSSKAKTDARKPSFEDSLKELEEILAQLETSQVPLSVLVEKYARAKECLESCKSQLESARLKISQLGESGLEDFEE